MNRKTTPDLPANFGPAVAATKKLYEHFVAYLAEEGRLGDQERRLVAAHLALAAAKIAGE